MVHVKKLTVSQISPADSLMTDYIGQTTLQPPSAAPDRSNLPALRRTYGLTKLDFSSQDPPTKLTTQIATRDTLSSKCFTRTAPLP
ncbi:hypothetical protein AMECASPLE_033905 [Ameca splendens]|uniref:Uncharacterized protein n=1 Tax=Ameca splendens TaxID=208324 RepID=A0ABV0Z665_9TELE